MGGLKISKDETLAVNTDECVCRGTRDDNFMQWVALQTCVDSGRC